MDVSIWTWREIITFFSTDILIKHWRYWGLKSKPTHFLRDLSRLTIVQQKGWYLEDVYAPDYGKTIEILQNIASKSNFSYEKALTDFLWLSEIKRPENNADWSNVSVFFNGLAERNRDENTNYLSHHNYLNFLITYVLLGDASYFVHYKVKEYLPSHIAMKLQPIVLLHKKMLAKELISLTKILSGKISEWDAFFLRYYTRPIILSSRVSSQILYMMWMKIKNTFSSEELSIIRRWIRETGDHEELEDAIEKI